MKTFTDAAILSKLNNESAIPKRETPFKNPCKNSCKRFFLGENITEKCMLPGDIDPHVKVIFLYCNQS